MTVRNLIPLFIGLIISSNAVVAQDDLYDHPVPSDGQFKFNVRSDVKGLDFILKLKPVTYQFDVKKFSRKIAGTDISHAILNLSDEKALKVRRTGFIAQEVEKAAHESHFIFSGIKKPSADNAYYRLSYESFVVPLVQAVQEEHMFIMFLQEKIETQDQKIKLLQKEMSSMAELVEQLTDRLNQLEKQ